MPLSEHHDAFLHTLAYESAASLRGSNYQQVDRGSRYGSGRYRRDYLYPASYRIEVRASDPALASRRCRWATTHGSVEGACAERVALGVGPGQAVGESWGVETELRLTVDGGPVFSYSIAFRDRLIVALGDSYVSGEGNPDVPSVVTDRPLPVFAHASWGARLREADGDYRPARWWDEPCHRSLLSWPVLASVAYSAHNPHEAVSLVHLGCSGAVVADILDRGEIELPGGGDELPGEPQLAQLDRLLDAVPPGAARRRPDQVLLSIGGNDSGFVGVLSTVILPPGGYYVPILGPILVGWGADAICPYVDTGRPLERLCRSEASAEVRLGRLSDSYDRLSGALARRGAARIHQFAYPNPISAEDGVCDLRAGRDPSGPEEMTGLEALMGHLPRFVRGHHYTWDFELQYYPERMDSDPLIPGVQCDDSTEPSDSEVCQALWVYTHLNRRVAENGSRPGWEIVTGHVGEIDGHGICRRDPHFLPALPRVRGDRWDGGWTPQRLRPYHRANERWFRTPNDSIVTQYGDPDHFHHGSFHPTFRAHLEYAQAALHEALLD